VSDRVGEKERGKEAGRKGGRETEREREASEVETGSDYYQATCEEVSRYAARTSASSLQAPPGLPFPFLLILYYSRA
jgi:hypothetical protein